MSSPFIVMSFQCLSGVNLVSFLCHSDVILESFWYHSSVFPVSLLCLSSAFLVSIQCHSNTFRSVLCLVMPTTTFNTIRYFKVEQSGFFLSMFCFNSENFLRLQIFYEDLSVFKTISEEAYKVSNLMESGFSDGQKPGKTSHLEKRKELYCLEYDQRKEKIFKLWYFVFEFQNSNS